MDPAKVKAWQRFYDQVLSRSDWPRGLWFAAVEDALRAAFGPDSRLLADYRADVDELLRLERTASGSYHDEKRRGQLEAQIKRLVNLADETVLQAAASEPAPPVALASKAPAARPRAMLGPAWSLVPAVVLLLAGIGGAAAYYEARMAAQADQQLAQMTALLDQRLAAARNDLDQRLGMADRMNRRMSLLHAELSASIDEFSATMTDSVRSMTALSDDTVAELERRLAEQGHGVGDSLAELHARADALGRGLDEVGEELRAIEDGLPDLRADLERIGTEVQRMGTDAGQTARAIDALKARPPELEAWLEGQRQELDQALRSGRDQVSAIDVQARAFESEVERSGELLQTLNLSLDQGLQQAKQDGAALETAVQEMRAVGAQVADLMAGAEAEVAAAQQAMRQRIDQMLTDLAGQADLAVLRGQDVVRRAQAEIDRRVASESEKALGALAQAREAQLAELAERVSAAQLELEQTRAALLAGWQRMDQAMVERRDQVLAGLDDYASTIETRVEEFLNALDVMVVRNGG